MVLVEHQRQASLPGKWRSKLSITSSPVLLAEGGIQYLYNSSLS